MKKQIIRLDKAQEKNPQKEILSFKEAIVYMDVSSSYLYKLTSKREIPFFKPRGGKLYFKKSDLDRWMLRNPCESISEKENEVLNYLKRDYYEQK